jgi:hypothetical protein
MGRVLRSRGLDVRVHQEIFPERDAADSISDATWIAHCGQQGWVAITHDNDITRTPESVAAVFQSGARLFILRGQLPFVEHANQFADHLARVERLAGRGEPFIAKVQRQTFKRGGARFLVDIGVWLSLEEWRSR